MLSVSHRQCKKKSSEEDVGQGKGREEGRREGNKPHGSEYIRLLCNCFESVTQSPMCKQRGTVDCLVNVSMKLQPTI